VAGYGGLGFMMRPTAISKGTQRLLLGDDAAKDRVGSDRHELVDRSHHRFRRSYSRDRLASCPAARAHASVCHGSSSRVGVGVGVGGERERAASLALNGLHNEKYLDISLSFSHSLSVSISRPCGFATATTLSPPTVSEERRPVGAPPCRAKPLHVASERAEQDRVAYPGRGYILRSFAK